MCKSIIFNGPHLYFKEHNYNHLLHMYYQEYIMEERVSNLHIVKICHLSPMALYKNIIAEYELIL